MATLENSKKGVYAALCDDFDTPSAISTLQELVSAANKYSQQPSLSSVVLTTVAKYVTSIFQTFGLVSGTVEVGFGCDVTGAECDSGVSREQVRDKTYEKEEEGGGGCSECTSFFYAHSLLSYPIDLYYLSLI